MYESFFGLSRKPFELRPDPSFMYFAERHVMALRMLEYGLFSHDGFTVITGDVGCGKTTVVRYLVERLSNDVSVGLVSNTHSSFGNMMELALMSFGVGFSRQTNAEAYEAFAGFVLSEHAHGKRVLLIVDEAQNLDNYNLEALRVLTNINSEGRQVLHTALIGQPELRDTLLLPALLQVRQRIAVSFHLDALSESETRGYVARRLELAGGRFEVFQPGTLAMIYRYSGGIPRLINVICDAALLYAYGQQTRDVGIDIVKRVLLDRRASQLMAIADPHADRATDPPSDPRPESRPESRKAALENSVVS